MSTQIPFDYLESGKFFDTVPVQLVMTAYIFRLITNEYGEQSVDYDYYYRQKAIIYPLGGSGYDFTMYYDNNHLLYAGEDYVIVFDDYTTRAYGDSGRLFDLTTNGSFLNRTDRDIMVRFTITSIGGQPADLTLYRCVYAHHMAELKESFEYALQDSYYYNGNYIHFTIEAWDTETLQTVFLASYQPA